MTSYDPNDFLRSGAKAAKFPTVGTTVKGVVTRLEVTQQIDYDTQKPMTYDDGNPAMQLEITLQTDEREDDGDNGERRLFVKGALKYAVSQAVRQSGSKLEEGGTLAVRYSGDKPNQNPRFSAIKQYEAVYKAAPAAGVDEFVGAGHLTADDLA